MKEKNSEYSNEAVENGDDKTLYLRLIESGRDTLSDDQMEILFTLYEADSMPDAAAVLGRATSNIQAVLTDIEMQLGFRRRPERTTKLGQTYKKRLGKAAYERALADLEMPEADRRVLEAIAHSPNQVVAAHRLGMTFKQLTAEHTRIRRTYEF